MKIKLSGLTENNHLFINILHPIANRPFSHGRSSAIEISWNKIKFLQRGEFKPYRIFWVQQDAHHLIVLIHKYGRRDVMP